MTLLTKLNKKLETLFDGKVHAELKEGCLYLTGELSNWDDIVRAGLLSVNKKLYTVVNDIAFTGGEIQPARMPSVSSNLLEGKKPDVLIVGGGIVGCAIARELSRYKLDIILAEKEHTVALHASGCSDGKILPGHSLRKGQLKKKYNDEGNRIYLRICKELNVSYRFTGQYLCFTEKCLMSAAFVSFFLRCKMMGIPVEYVSRRKLLQREPHLNDNTKFAFFFPAAGVICPYDLTVAYAENAIDNGVKINLDTAVVKMEVNSGKIKSVLTNHGRIYPRLVINAAGVFAEEIASLANDRFFSIHPKRIINTVNGLLLTCPNAAETYEKENSSADNKGGIQAASYEDDFIVTFGRFTKNIIHAAGIQAPGLTSAPAIAVDVSGMAARYLSAFINEQFNPIRIPKAAI